MVEHGFAYGKDVREYLKLVHEHLSVDLKPYSHIENEKLRLLNSMIDYTFYLFTKNDQKDKAFNRTFEETYKMVDPGAVKLSNQTYTLISRNVCLSSGQVRSTLIQLMENLDLEKHFGLK